MSLALSERLADVAGPLVVKELRQGLRGRVFGIFFGLVLLACFAMAVTAWAFGHDWGRDLGPDFLSGFLWAMGAVGWFVIPFSAFRNLAREREEETWVLLVLTGLPARSIVGGKFASALGQAGLFASACAPFVVFSYYLNGVSVVQVLVGLGLTFCWSVLLTAAGLALATQARSKLGRAATHFAVLAVLGAGSALGVAFTGALAHEGSRLFAEPGFVGFCAGIALFSLGGAWVVLEGAAYALSLPSEATARAPRFALLCLVVSGWVGGAVALGLGALDDEGALAASIITSLVLLVAGAFATSEEDGFVRATRAKSTWDVPGAYRSTVAVYLLLLGSAFVWFLLFSAAGSSSYREGRSLRTLVAGPAYVAMYLSLGAFLGRATPLSRWGEGLATRVSFLAVTAVGSLAPPLLGELGGVRGNDRALNVLNPVVGMINFVDRIYDSEGGALLTLLLAAAGVCVVLGLAALGTRDGERST